MIGEALEMQRVFVDKLAVKTLNGEYTSNVLDGHRSLPAQRCQPLRRGATVCIRPKQKTPCFVPIAERQLPGGAIIRRNNADNGELIRYEQFLYGISQARSLLVKRGVTCKYYLITWNRFLFIQMNTSIAFNRVEYRSTF